MSRIRHDRGGLSGAGAALGEGRLNKRSGERPTRAGAEMMRAYHLSPFTFRPRQSAFAVALGLLQAACAVLLMFMSGYLICRTAQDGTTLFAVLVPVALVQIFGIGRPLARYFERLISHDWVLRITSALRLKLFGAIAGQANDPSAKRTTGDYLSLLADDVGHLQNLYLRVTLPIAIGLALFVGSCVFAGIFSISLGTALFVIGLFSAVLLPLATRSASRTPIHHAKTLRAQEFAALADDIMGLKDWALSGRSGEAARLHAESLESSRNANAAVRSRARMFELIEALVLAFGAMIVLAFGGQAFGGNATSTPWIAAFALGFFPLAETFALLPGACADANTHDEALGNLSELLDQTPVEEPASKGAPEPANAAETDKDGNDAAIEITHATFRYPDSRSAAIDDLSLIIPTGQKIAILGRSGAGKSTLAALMRASLAPDAGLIRIDGTNAQGMVNPAKTVGFVPQDPYIFSRTLRENLALGNRDATDEALVAALEAVGLGQLLALPGGLDAPLGEMGTGLSGGQAHRVALARALVADTPIVILDEPFTALDTKTECALIDTLLEAFADKTLIVITHHLMRIARFDRVVFVNEGRISLDGTPQGLARENDGFQRLLAFDCGSTH